MELDYRQNIIFIGIFIFMIIITVYSYGKYMGFSLSYICSDKDIQEAQHIHPNDYNSNDGMLTSIWGSALWHVLHTISFNYKVNPNEEEKKNYKIFIESLQYTLPCSKCRQNFSQNLKKYPITDDVMANRESFSRYIYEMHNIINKDTGKPSYKTYEEVRDHYEQFRARCQQTAQKNKGAGCVVPLYKKQKCQISFVPA